MTESRREITIIGCGFAGIGMGIALKKAGIQDFSILESAADVGGTWRDNTYPGVAVDIPSFTYSFSFEQRPDWSRLFAPGAELKRYADDCVRKYQLTSHIRFHARVRAVRFLERAGVWRVELENGESFQSRFVISATGLFSQPKQPTFPGLATFAGPVIHSARWPKDLDLRGKRVAIVGTGATSVQLVPALCQQVAQLHVFQRTPIWVLPKPDAPLPRAAQRLLRHVPGVQELARAGTTAGTELVMVLAIVYHKQFPYLVRSIEALGRLHLVAQVRDPALREKLTPRYGFGCNRPTFSNTYLASFNRPNVRLETHGIRDIQADGIVTGDGRQLKADALIMATGFKTYEKGNLPTYAVYGKDGLELGAFWEAERYQAYLGACVPRFPNYFMMIGPNSATGSSWFAMVENQAAHIMRCLREARARGAALVEVKAEAHARYFAKLQARQQNTVFFNNQCGRSSSYYFDQHGDALFYRPASGMEAFLESRLSPLSDYLFTQVDSASQAAASASAS